MKKIIKTKVSNTSIVSNVSIASRQAVVGQVPCAHDK
jgi:hypothetical protein